MSTSLLPTPLYEQQLHFDGEIDFYRGKVRDVHSLDDGRLLMVASDRISAFDVVLPRPIPFKGQVLNQLAAFWFENTADIVDNHVLDVPHPNATVCREAQPLPVEVVVRGYITGVTSTSPDDVLDGALDPFMAAALSQKVTGEKVDVEDVD